MFSRILIANRGEIALRILRACRELGVESVVAFSEADRDFPYVHLADRAICIGPPAAARSYLNIPALISAADVTDADAIHPGYGFLAENPRFAEICEECGLAFIGPPARAMQLLGDKVAARRLAREAGVPVVPGSEGVLRDQGEAMRVAGRIGYPVMIKAAAGGGGRGMRQARDEAELRGAFAAAGAEARAAFGNDALYLEKLIVEPRHVEVQVMADEEGRVLHFHERDCSIQRRHQKLIEEAPCPTIDGDKRQELCAAAVELIRRAEYSGAGTVEFLLDPEGSHHFIEVNARIQVEHPVTEMVTGWDLIKLQIETAAGNPLRIGQEEIELRGAALECRINAEDPTRDHRACPGRITTFIPPGGPGIRVETHIAAGATISPHYDSLIAKVIAHRPTREEAVATMKRALQEFMVEPLPTTIPTCLQQL